MNKKNNASLLKRLQLEYLTYQLRAITYRDEGYARVAGEIAEKKRNRIITLGKKLSIATLFSAGYDVAGFVNKFFWKPKGLPNFVYRDAEQRKIQFTYDAWALLYKYTDIFVDGEKYCVASNNPAKGYVCAKKYDEEGKLGTERFGFGYDQITLVNNYTLV